MKSFTVDSFWEAFDKLPEETQQIARNKFAIWKENPFHPGLKFKCVNTAHDIWSVRITRDYRALGIMNDKEIIWYWIGSHTDYEKLLKH
jgi:hypothetical protein